jgi:hypothetical protein
VGVLCGVIPGSVISDRCVQLNFEYESFAAALSGCYGRHVVLQKTDVSENAFFLASCEIVIISRCFHKSHNNKKDATMIKAQLKYFRKYGQVFVLGSKRDS